MLHLKVFPLTVVPAGLVLCPEHPSELGLVVGEAARVGVDHHDEDGGQSQNVGGQNLHYVVDFSSLLFFFSCFLFSFLLLLLS